MNEKKMMENNSTYSGKDNLDVMKVAKNYNTYLINKIKKSFKNRPRIMDFGAGDGYFANELRSESPVFLCVETDTTYRHLLRKQGFTVAKNLNEQASESMDLIYSLNVLEHINEDTMILRQFNRILCNGGMLFLYVPAFPLLYTSMDKRVGHVRRYKKSELLSKIKKSGFSIKTAHYVDSLGFLATLLFKIINKSDGRIDSDTIGRYDKYIFPLSLFFDNFLRYLLGKNILVLAEKKS